MTLARNIESNRRTANNRLKAHLAKQILGPLKADVTPDKVVETVTDSKQKQSRGLAKAALAGAAIGMALVPLAEKGYVTDAVDVAAAGWNRVTSGNALNGENPDYAEEVTMRGSGNGPEDAWQSRDDISPQDITDSGMTKHFISGATEQTGGDQSGASDSITGNYTYPTSEDVGINYTVQAGDSPASIADDLAEQGTVQHQHIMNEVTLEGGTDGLHPGESMHLGDTPVPVEPKTNPGE